jgi:hypothetical protein
VVFFHGLDRPGRTIASVGAPAEPAAPAGRR